MSFADDMRKFADKAGRGFDEVVIESLVSLSSATIVGTPVDTGILANNWRPSTDTPKDGTVDHADNSGQMADVEVTVAASVGGVYWLVNNLPYAHPIEFDGHSEKAPAGMLRVAIEDYQNFLNDAINNLN